jgi:hypothetical protein
MKFEWKLMAGVTVFFAIVSLIYWFTSYESGGTALLVFSFAAYAMLGAILWLFWSRRKGIPRPEDNPDGTYEEGEGVVAFFPAASLFPVAAGLGFTFVALALIFGTWYWCIGLPLIAGAMFGLMMEGESVDHPEDAERQQLDSRNGTADGASRPHDRLG